MIIKIYVMVKLVLMLNSKLIEKSVASWLSAILLLYDDNLFGNQIVQEGRNVNCQSFACLCFELSFRWALHKVFLPRNARFTGKLQQEGNTQGPRTCLPAWEKLNFGCQKRDVHLGPGRGLGWESQAKPLTSQTVSKIVHINYNQPFCFCCRE